MSSTAVVSAKGAQRWAHGHPWIYRSDVITPPDAPASAVRVIDARHRALGWALWSPRSEIALRLLERSPDAVIDSGWWRRRLSSAIERRAPLAAETNACRLVH